MEMPITIKGTFMVKKQLVFWASSVILIIISTVTALLAEERNLIVDCEMSRITIPMAEKDGKLTCAASFIYGEYAIDPISDADMLTGNQIIDDFNASALPEEERWQYPEYLVAVQSEAFRSGNKEKFLNGWESGYSRNKAKQAFEPRPEGSSSLDTFTETILLDKAVFGPYTRISFGLREPSNIAGEKGRGIGGWAYFNRVDNRYFRVYKSFSFFDSIVSYYGGSKILGKRHISIDPNTANMKCIAFDVDIDSPPEDKKILATVLTEEDMELSDTISENALYLYMNLEPVNIELKPGERLPDLSPEMRFFESAVTKQKFGSEAEILACWSGKSRDRLENRIKQLKENEEWPQIRVYPLRRDPFVVAFLRTSESTIFYYKERKSSSPVSAVGLLVDKQGNYSFSEVNHLPNNLRSVFDDELFRNAVWKLYNSTNPDDITPVVTK
jgi:hypothetical protein